MDVKAQIKKFFTFQGQPMSQFTYWFIFIACGCTYTLVVISYAASASYKLILENPDIASSSWLVKGFFF